MEKLSGISETLLITLYFRYLESKKTDAIIYDAKSVEIIERIDTDLSHFENDKISQLSVAIRSKVFDEQTQIFLNKNPDSIVVNLAAGLCTRFFRLNQNNVKWYDLDLEEVKPLWMRLIGETEQHKFINHSVLDSSWTVFFQKDKDKKILFILEGLSMYLDEQKMRTILMTLKNNFPNSEFVFDAISTSALTLDYSQAAVSKTNAKFTWGIDFFKEIETWNSGISLINEWLYFDMYIDRWKSLNLEQEMLQFKTMGKIGHFKFS
jgi:O-methyltransferase involved in polyketide biosynthesis